ncbi:MAG: protein translocase subunit SecD, partial [Pseudomonadota bacterium]
MLDFPPWKTALILLACFTGVIFAAPNLFYERVERANDAREAVEAGLPAEPGAAEGWPGFLPGTLVNLGLDLRGGAHVLVEVALEDVYAERMEGTWPEVLRALREVDAVGTVR